MKKTFGADKRAYLDSLAVEAEEAARHGNVNTHKNSLQYLVFQRPVKDKNMASIVGEGQRKRWVEFFVELLNRPAPKDPVDIQPAYHDLPRNTWCRNLEADPKETGYTWGQLERFAQDRSACVPEGAMKPLID